MDALLAQGLGAKPDLVVPTTNASGVGLVDLLQMVVALAIVFALLKWALPKVVAKMNKRLSAKDGSSITVEESASFGGGSLQIVTARGRTLLLCVAQSGVTCLADLTGPAPKHDDQPAFFELVDRAVVEQPADKDRVALDRLTRLTG
jgi:flagellar biogenesis protein FliO